MAVQARGLDVVCQERRFASSLGHARRVMVMVVVMSVIMTVLITRERVLMQCPARHIPQHHGKERDNRHQGDVTLAGHANPGQENRMTHGRIMPKHPGCGQSTSIPR